LRERVRFAVASTDPPLCRTYKMSRFHAGHENIRARVAKVYRMAARCALRLDNSANNFWASTSRDLTSAPAAPGRWLRQRGPAGSMPSARLMRAEVCLGWRSNAFSKMADGLVQLPSPNQQQSPDCCAPGHGRIELKRRFQMGDAGVRLAQAQQDDPVIVMRIGVSPASAPGISGNGPGPRRSALAGPGNWPGCFPPSSHPGFFFTYRATVPPGR